MDPQWYAGHGEVTLGPPPPGRPPVVVDLEGEVQVIGRQSISRGITPDLDCSPDTGVSRRHAGLQAGGGRLYLEDLGSANGTFLARAGEPIPDLPITPGLPVEVGEGDRIYLGAWSRITIRRTAAETVRLTTTSRPERQG